MKENERLKVVEKIEKDIRSDEILAEQNEELKILAKDEKVKRYLELKSSVNKIKNMQLIFKNDVKRMIEWEFYWAFQKRINSEEFSSCEHDIWIYEGSYIQVNDENFSLDKEYKCDNEEDNNFLYNKYVCLECDEKIIITDWKEFEKGHIVLKNRDDNNINLYRWLYYQELYKSSVEEAKKYVINEFYMNLINGYSKKRIK